jgi:dual specificity phosphatase 3
MSARTGASDGGAFLPEDGPVADISCIASRVWTGGDLPSDLGEDEMLDDLVAIQNAGITHILDNRIEWSDEEFIRTHAPELHFLWNGADDMGQPMPDEWFDVGVQFALEGLDDPDAQVLAHCHAGINRGPSMAYAILLATGMEPVAALTAVRRARPIAAIAYDGDALDWWHRRADTPEAEVMRQLAEVDEWHRDNPWDVDQILRLMRNNEAERNNDGGRSPA